MLKMEPNNQSMVKINSFCHMPFVSMIMVADGQIVQCCHQAAIFGSLLETENALDIWRNNLSQKIRATTLNNELHSACRHHNTCPHLSKKEPKKDFWVYRKFTYPTRLEICLPDKHCNIGGENPNEENPACIMCRRNFNMISQEDFTEVLCAKAKPLMPFIKKLSVLGTAEPFWKDAVFKVFDQLEFQRYKHQVEFDTNTNGICFTERSQRLFFAQVKHSHIQWSLDAATPNTYKRIRRVNGFDTIVENLKHFVKLKNDFGNKNHFIQIWNNINMINLDEVPLMIEQAAEWGIDTMYLLPTYNQEGVINLGDILMNENNIHLFSRMGHIAAEKAKQLGVTLYFHRSFHELPTEQLIQINVRS